MNGLFDFEHIIKLKNHYSNQKKLCFEKRKLSLALPTYLKFMYKSLLYSKEWNWRNVKMEAREQSVVLRP